MWFENRAQQRKSIPSPKETSVTDTMHAGRSRQDLLSSYLNTAKQENTNLLLFSPAARSTKDQDANVIGQLERKKVYKVDLITEASKYTNETEKNLERLFAEASSKQWVLFFDNADALFSKSEQPGVTAGFIQKYAQSKNVVTILWCEEDCPKWFGKSKYVLVQ
jgi:hypothetical protein